MADRTAPATNSTAKRIRATRASRQTPAPPRDAPRDEHHPEGHQRHESQLRKDVQQDKASHRQSLLPRRALFPGSRRLELGGQLHRVPQAGSDFLLGIAVRQLEVKVLVVLLHERQALISHDNMH